MKKQISELINEYPPECIPMEAASPLNQQRIKEITMRKINKKTTGRHMARTIALAATISILVLTVAAHTLGAGDFFRDILQRQLDHEQAPNVQQTLTQEQVDLVTELGKADGQTAESRGSKLTLNAYYGDQYILKLLFHLEAPEGTALPEDALYVFYQGEKDQEELRHDDMMDETVYYPLLQEVEPLPDDVPGDNKKDFQVTIRGQEGSPLHYATVDQERLHIGGIYQQIVDKYGDDDAFERIVGGDFSFTIGKTHAYQPLNISMDAMEYSGENIRSWSHPAGMEGLNANGHFDMCPPYDENGVHTVKTTYRVKPTQFELTPLDVCWACEYESSDPNMLFMLDFQVVLKDGSVVPTYELTGGYGSGDETGKGFSGGVHGFAVPLDYNQVDYILIGNPQEGTSHKIDFSQYVH